MKNQMPNNVVEGAIYPTFKCLSDGFANAEGTPLAKATLGDFWSWAMSDVIVNRNRGILAEFLVAKALGVAESPRVEWDPFDLETPDGVSVEVKCSAYLQSWYQEEPSRPTFSIGKRQGWDHRTGQYDEESKRRADVYVFCVHSYRGAKEWLDPLDIEQWDFYVVSTSRIDRELGDQESFRAFHPPEVEWGKLPLTGCWPVGLRKRLPRKQGQRDSRLRVVDGTGQKHQGPYQEGRRSLRCVMPGDCRGHARFYLGRKR